MPVIRGHRHIGGDWHYCARCMWKTQISDLSWQQGSLICNRARCDDKQQTLGLLGSRDADIARKIEYATSDLQPDPKLSMPDTPDQDLYF